MKNFLSIFAKRFFVDVPAFVTMPILIIWVLMVYFAMFGETALSESYWFRVGSIIVVMVSALAFFFWPDRE